MGKVGKILLNILVLLIVTGFVWYLIRSVNKEEISYTDISQEQVFDSPFQIISSFDLPEEINRMEWYNNKLYISGDNKLYTYDAHGQQLHFFNTRPNVRDVAVNEDEIFILYPTSIEVYSLTGELIREWEACSELSDYCSFTVVGNFVFVTDAENKNICKYTREGNFITFIQSPRGFIIPSYSFDIANYNDTIYCVNSGRHLIESYTLDGTFIAAFGGSGSEAGFFAGCCNPVYISFTQEGEILTSEKGNPRICLFERKGKLRMQMLNSRLLGGGNKAYEIETDGDNFFVGGGKKIRIFQLKEK